MKKLLLYMGLVLILVGCTNVENEEEQTQPVLSLEEQIEEVMNQHDYPPQTIVNYEIKNDFIYVFTDTNSSLNVAVLEYLTDSIEWIMDYKSIEKMSILDPEYENMPVLTVVKTEDANIASVKVLGEPAKGIQYSKEVTDDYAIYTKYWIHFTEMKEEYADFENQNLPVNSIEFIE
ncbi:hypothetical protein [Paraliobacillus sp. X-1268]|uniref:hypothetical protein n=1 Tax=Paraliobacillus sp. X-1268 TaxID=2213193 RepID=UPI000E3B8B59|nr:hypothetical protein [Paraliobacillus sp. X-1268]